MNLWLPGANNIGKYPKLSKVTNFCSNQNKLFSEYFGIFLWLIIVKRISNEILNSWRQEPPASNLINNMKIDFKNYPFFQVCSLPQGYSQYFFDFALRNVPFQRQNITPVDWVGLDWTYGLNYDNPSPHYFHSTLIFFIIDYIVQSHFVPVLKTLSSQPNPNIVDCSFVFKMLGHYYPQNIWYFEFAENYDF